MRPRTYEECLELALKTVLADEDDKRRRQIEKKLAAEPWEDVACFERPLVVSSRIQPRLGS